MKIRWYKEPVTVFFLFFACIIMSATDEKKCTLYTATYSLLKFFLYTSHYSVTYKESGMLSLFKSTSGYEMLSKLSSIYGLVSHLKRTFSVTSCTYNETKHSKIKVPKLTKMPPRPKLPENELKEKFIKGGSGHGGQKINKTNSKVQLTHVPTGIVISCQATRSRDQNRKIARQILALKVDQLKNGDKSWKALKGAREKIRKQRAKRKSKAKYRKLREEKEAEMVKQKPDSSTASQADKKHETFKNDCPLLSSVKE